MSLFGLFEHRGNAESATTPLTSATLLDLLGGAPGDAGVAVTETSALNMSAVYRCTSLVSSVAASLPLHSYQRKTKKQETSDLLDDPHPEMTGYEVWKLGYCHRCLWGNSYTQKLRSPSGQVKELWPITPSRVQVGRVRPSEANPAGKLFQVVDDWGEYHVLTSRDILHIPALGYDGVTGCSPVRLAAQGIGMALAAEKYGAKLFGSGNLLSGILQTEQRLQESDATRLQARWEKLSGGLDRSHKVAVLDSGAKFQSLTMPSDDAEMLATRQFQITELARYFGVPAFLLMQTEKQTSWGTALEQQAQGWVTFDLHPQWLAPTEQRISKELLVRGKYAKYTLEGLLRGDSQARAEFYRVMREVGAYNVDDIRELEDRPPLADGLGQGHLQPMNFVPLGTQPVPGATGSGDPAGAGTSSSNGKVRH